MKHRSLITDAGVNKLEQRLGRLHAKLRLGIELDHEAQIFGQGINFFHIENWYSVHSVIRTTLKLVGLYWRGRKNTDLKKEGRGFLILLSGFLGGIPRLDALCFC
jgi:hypothetical protein